MKKHKLLFAALFAGVFACVGASAAGCSDMSASTGCTHEEMSHVAAADPTCNHIGNLEYWYCKDCKKYFSTADAKEEFGLSSFLLPVDETKHNYGTFIESMAATCSAPGILAHYHCNVCNKDFDENKKPMTDIMLDVNPDVHDIEYVASKDATCNVNGNTEYWRCAGCHKYFSDANAKNEIELSSTVITGGIHAYGEWSYDYDTAAYVRICENNANHVESKAAGESAELPYLVNSADGFTAAVANGGYIKLTDSVELSAKSIVGKNVTLDLNGKTLAQNAVQVSKDASFVISNGKLEVNVTSSSKSVYAFDIYGSISMSGVECKVNLASTQTSKSQSFYALYTYNDDSAVAFKDGTSFECAVVSKTKEDCAITVYGVYAGKGSAEMSGASLKAGTVIYLGSSNVTVTLSDTNIDYTDCGINMRYNGGKVEILQGVTFSGATEKPAIIIAPSRNNATVDDSKSGYTWTLDKVISDCSSYEPVIESYVCGDITKYVYTDKYPEHSYGAYEYDEDWGQYISSCAVCGAQNFAYAGDSEECYYPVKDETSLKNAVGSAWKYIKLESNVTVTSSYNYQIVNAGCVLDLNGHTVTVNNNVYFNLSGDNVTIKNGTIRRPAGVSYSYGLKINGGNVTVDGIDIDSGINVVGATATVKNCTVTLNCDWAYYNVCAQSVNVNGVTVYSSVVVENCKMVRTQAGKENCYFWVQSGSSMKVKNCTFESTCGTAYYLPPVSPEFDPAI